MGQKLVPLVNIQKMNRIVGLWGCSPTRFGDDWYWSTIIIHSSYDSYAWFRRESQAGDAFFVEAQASKKPTGLLAFLGGLAVVGCCRSVKNVLPGWICRELWLVGLDHVLLFHIVEKVIPTDLAQFFKRGRCTTNQMYLLAIIWCVLALHSSWKWP